MRILLTTLLLWATSAMATNYYVSNAGSDAAAGTSTGTAWQTITKVNASTFASGDSILFRKGDTFYGAIVHTHNSIIVSSYGTGAKPIRTGMNTVTGWTSVGGGIYKASTPYAKNSLQVVTLDGKPQRLACTPDVGYYYYTASDSTTLQYNFTGAPSYVGGQVVWFLNAFDVKKARITAQSLSAITFAAAKTINPSNPNVSYGTGKANYGFKLQNTESCLTQLGEWRLDSTTKELRMYFGAADPNDYVIQASGIDTLDNLGSRTGITTIGLEYIGANYTAIYSNGGGTPTVKSCDFNNNLIAVWVYRSSTTVVDGCNINNSLSIGAAITNRDRLNVSFTNNTVDSTGLDVGTGCQNWDKCLNGVYIDVDSTTVGNSNVFTGNTVTYCGASGLEFQGSNWLIQYNLFTWWCRTQQDEGAIYTFVANTTAPTKVYRFRSVLDNICGNAPGATDILLTHEPDVAGIYFDDQSMNIYCASNTVFNVSGNGYQGNTTKGVYLMGNTFYNDSFAIGFNAKAIGIPSNNWCDSNIIFSVLSAQKYVNYSDADLNLPVPQTKTQSISGFASFDSNYVRTLAALPVKLYINPDSPSPFSNISLTTWTGTYGHDVTLTGPPVTVVTYSFAYNATSTPTTVLFPGLVKRDMLGATYTNSATLDPYQSLVLIDTGVTPPVTPGQRAPMFFRPMNRN
jgi:hypothetical protein